MYYKKCKRYFIIPKSVNAFVYIVREDTYVRRCLSYYLSYLVSIISKVSQEHHVIHAYWRSSIPKSEIFVGFHRLADSLSSFGVASVR